MSTHGLSSPAGEPYFSLENLWLAADSSRGASAAVKARDWAEEVPPLLDWDGANIFVMVASLLFLAQMATYGAILFTLSVVVYALRHHGAAREAIRKQGFFLLFPAYAMLSTLWSEVPAETLKHSGEFTLTVMAALLIIQVRNRRSMMFAMFAAFALYSVASLAFGNVVKVGTTGATALSGLADSKNAQASVVAVGAIISLAWLFIGLKTRRYGQSILALPILAVEIYSAILAKSAGALAALAVGLFLFLLFAALTRMGRRLRVALVGFGGVSALALAITFLMFTGPIVEALSNWFGKDTTLTGRTYLWARARDLIVEQPILGRGFDAFWQQGNLDAEGLWQFAHIATRTGFNFHNTSYDILVNLGWLGLILFVITLIAGLVRMAAIYVKRPSFLTAFLLAMGASLVVRLPVETMGIYEFSFDTVLLFAILGYAAAASDVSARLDSRAAFAARGNAASLSPAGPYAL
jgi:exopolysaccharide production protein ExoQ